MTRGFVIFIAVIVLGCAYVVSVASGADAQIVALGASNTKGKGVASDETYSARLEALLRSRGIAVTVTNEGVGFDTLSGTLISCAASWRTNGWKGGIFDRRCKLRVERCRFLSVIFGAGGGIVPFLKEIGYLISIS